MSIQTELRRECCREMATKLASDSWVVTPTREGCMDNSSLIMSSVKLKEKSSVRNCSWSQVQRGDHEEALVQELWRRMAIAGE